MSKKMRTDTVNFERYIFVAKPIKRRAAVKDRGIVVKEHSTKYAIQSKSDGQIYWRLKSSVWN